MTKGEAAAIVGLAPHAQDSGTLKGHRRIFGGRREVAASLYMAALSTLRYDPMMPSFARRLRERGKPPKVAITAIMRKLGVIMNAALKTGEPARRPMPVGRLQTFAATAANWKDADKADFRCLNCSLEFG